VVSGYCGYVFSVYFEVAVDVCIRVLFWVFGSGIEGFTEHSDVFTVNLQITISISNIRDEKPKNEQCSKNHILKQWDVCQEDY